MPRIPHPSAIHSTRHYCEANSRMWAVRRTEIQFTDTPSAICADAWRVRLNINGRFFCRASKGFLCLFPCIHIVISHHCVGRGYRSHCVRREVARGLDNDPRSLVRYILHGKVDDFDDFHSRCNARVSSFWRFYDPDVLTRVCAPSDCLLDGLRLDPLNNIVYIAVLQDHNSIDLSGNCMNTNQWIGKPGLKGAKSTHPWPLLPQLR